MIAFPLLLLGNAWDSILLEGLGLILFVICWLANILIGIVYVWAWFKGRYDQPRNLS